MDEVKVGGEVDAWCTSCREMKWHVVVAMADGKPAKVECLGCHKQHGYRPQPPGTPKPKAASSRTRAAAVPQAPPPPDDLEARLAAGEASARPYTPKGAWTVGEFVRHPTFGVGIVTGLPAAQKMDVAFRSGHKLLVHQRAESAQPALQRPARHDEDAPSYVTDAPPKD